MFWKARVPISRQTYYNFRIIIFFSRLSGYFPLKVEQKGSRLFLKWSPFWALYGLLLGALLVFRSIWELYVTYVMRGKKTMVKSTTDKITMILAHAGWITLFFCGVFIMSNKFLKLFDYIRSINEIDRIIRTTHKKSERYLEILIMAVAPTLAIAYCGNNFKFFQTVGISAWEVVEMTGGYYALYICTMMVFFVIRCIICGVTKRIGRLNQLLEKEHTRLQQMDGLILTGKLGTPRRDAASSRTVRAISESVGIVGECNGYTTTKLAKIYLKICEAANVGNEIFSETVTIALVVAFIQTVQPVYFMTISVQNSATFSSNIAVSLLSVLRNLFCALMVIEAAYTCSLQIKTTEKLVTQLLCNNISSNYRFQVKRFIICLGLQKIEISASGIFIVDRFLVTSMTGSAVTFLLLLLQMQEDNKRD